MKCRRNFKKTNSLGNNGYSSIFFSSKGIDFLGHGIYENDEKEEHEYYLITCIKEKLPDSWTAEELYYDCYYIIDGEKKFKVNDFGEIKLLNIDEIKNKLMTKKLKIIDNLFDFSSFLLSIYNKQYDYSEDAESVVDSLIQRLSILKGELWYKKSYGLPLLDKVKSKGFIDIVALQIISSHPAITNIVSFNSEMTTKHTYSCSFIVTTIFTSEKVKRNLTIQL